MELANVREIILEGKELVVKNATKDFLIPVKYDLSGRAKDILLAGGLLNYTKQQSAK